MGGGTSFFHGRSHEADGNQIQANQQENQVYLDTSPTSESRGRPLLTTRLFCHTCQRAFAAFESSRTFECPSCGGSFVELQVANFCCDVEINESGFKNSFFSNLCHTTTLAGGAELHLQQPWWEMVAQCV